MRRTALLGLTLALGLACGGCATFKAHYDPHTPAGQAAIANDTIFAVETGAHAATDFGVNALSGDELAVIDQWAANARGDLAGSTTPLRTLYADVESLLASLPQTSRIAPYVKWAEPYLEAYLLQLAPPGTTIAK